MPGFEPEEFDSGAAFLQIADTAKRGCVLLDMRMPQMDGWEVQQKMNEKGIQMPVIAVTGHGDIQTAIHSMRMGAINFFEKPHRKELLLEAVGEAFQFLEISEMRMIASSKAKARLSCLSSPERDILDGLMNGRANKSIAFDLGISPRAVEVLRVGIIERLGVKNIAMAIRVGFFAAFDDTN